MIWGSDAIVAEWPGLIYLSTNVSTRKVASSKDCTGNVDAAEAENAESASK